ncbi:hypothetical protein V1634_01605 [Plantactinospora veratri]|uniref:Uncharacterized protein n=1 Tax=Plantactinospora veratri TaxID=1436122 RepID=A0ABU7S6G5_9ACTN
MSNDTDLLMSLDGEPPGPSSVDVRRAIADGRRRRRVRRGIGYTGAAAVTALALAGASVATGALRHSPAAQTTATGTSGTAVAAPYAAPGTAGWSVPAATPPGSCTLDRLPTPDNAPAALVSGADPTGRYLVGRSYPGAGGYQAVIWHDGRADKVMLPGDLEESLQDVNSTGTAVGWSFAGDGEADTGPVPYVYHDGKVSKLPGVRRGSAYAINNAGAIAGDDSSDAALVWPSATAEPSRLPLPPGASKATARDIDEDGTVVGTMSVAGTAAPSAAGIAPVVPYVWFPDGTHRPLPMPTLDGKPAVSASVFSVRNGWAAGVASVETAAIGLQGAGDTGDTGEAGVARAVRWNVRTGEVRVFAELRFGAETTNAHGWQVGTNRQGRAVLRTDTATVVLPDLAGQPPGGLATIASTLSDDGRVIAGQSDDAKGKIQAVVWRCR